MYNDDVRIMYGSVNDKIQTNMKVDRLQSYPQPVYLTLILICSYVDKIIIQTNLAADRQAGRRQFMASTPGAWNPGYPCFLNSTERS